MADIYSPPGAPGAYEAITPGDTATSITPSKLTNISGQQATGAIVTVEANTVNVAIDGGTATLASGTNYGHKMVAKDTIVLRSIEALKNFNCVDDVSSSAGIAKVTIFF
jgi:hypothetical protein